MKGILFQVLFGISLAAVSFDAIPTLYPDSARHLDPCSQVCGEFAPDRRGAGASLCELEVSRCIESYGNVSAVCTYLYWSETETGEAGLIYSLDGQDLLPDEISRVLTCEEAVEILQTSHPRQQYH